MARILKHEIEWLREIVAHGEQENHKVAIDMANAVENGNVWHDNAEYDAAIEEMKRIDSKYRPVMAALANAEIVDYPVGASTVALGSLMKLKDSYETYDALLIGDATINISRYESMWAASGNEDEITLLSGESPMGMSLLGKKVGEIALWRVQDRELSAEVVAIDNSWLFDSINESA